MKRFIVDYTDVYGKKDFTCVDAENEFDAVRAFYEKAAFGIENDPFVKANCENKHANWLKIAMRNHTVTKVAERMEG